MGYVRVTAGGNISGSQTWSVGLSLAADDATTVATLQDFLAGFRTIFETRLWASTGTTLRQRNSAQVTLARYRAYYYPFAGQPVGAQAAIDITPLAGQAGGGYHPTQVSLVASLLTGLPGRSYRGRMYLPFTGATLENDNQASLTDITAMATGVKNLIADVNTLTTTTGPGDVVIAGSAGNIPVTSVRVDSECDIQRRRANKVLALRTNIQNV